MMTTLTIKDETASGEVTHTFTLENLTEQLTVRELLRARIYQEVQEYNARQRAESGAVYRGLVEPTDTERALNGVRLKSPRLIDWEAQYKKACEAFLQNGFFVIVDQRQAEGLDEVFTVRVDTEVSFVKLVPLVGG